MANIGSTDPAIDWDTITLDLSSTNVAALGTMDSIVYTSSVTADTITLGSAGAGDIAWSNGSGTFSLGDFSIDRSNSASIKLTGEDADIDINGVSLMETLRGIQQRLNLLQPNMALESEWEELRALGDQYRQLEQQIKDKMATWDRLQAMPPPQVD